jgi:hypothetical protein
MPARKNETRDQCGPAVFAATAVTCSRSGLSARDSRAADPAAMTASQRGGQPQQATCRPRVQCAGPRLGGPWCSGRVDLPLGLPEVMADTPVAERVIANLTANALRYSRLEGGFNRSSQHLDSGGADGQASGLDDGADGGFADEVAGCAGASAGGRARVLA